MLANTLNTLANTLQRQRQIKAEAERPGSVRSPDLQSSMHSPPPFCGHSPQQATGKGVHMAAWLHGCMGHTLSPLCLIGERIWIAQGRKGGTPTRCTDEATLRTLGGVAPAALCR